jgi:hypothetical protein
MAVVPLEELGELKNSYLVWNQTRDLSASSIVPRRAMLPRAPSLPQHKTKNITANGQWPMAFL